MGVKLQKIVDRKEEIRKLVRSLSNPRKTVNYALIGPRQIGKTTILRAVQQRLEQKRLLVIYLDFGQYRYSPSEFASSIVREGLYQYARQLGTLEKTVMKAADMFGRLRGIRKVRPIFEVGTDETGHPSVLVKFEQAEEDPREALRVAFQYVSQLANQSGRRVVVILDEFQYYAEFASDPRLRGAMDIFRTALDARGNVCFVLSGSRVHFLRNVLSDGRSPLFGRFAITEVNELEERYGKELFIAATKTSASSAETAYELVGGHPFYLLAIAENHKPGEEMKKAYFRLLDSPTGALRLYVNYILAEDLGSGLRGARFLKILRSLRSGALTISQISNVTAIKLTNLPWYLQKLIEYDLVVKSDGAYQIRDKVVRDYFARGAV